MLETYVSALDECGADAVSIVCRRISTGQAGLNSSFPPTPADIAERALMLTAAKPAPVQYNGLLEMDFGHGRIDMRGLTAEQQDTIIRAGGKMPDGRNAALLTLAQKIAGLSADALSAADRQQLQKVSGE